MHLAKTHVWSDREKKNKTVGHLSTSDLSLNRNQNPGQGQSQSPPLMQQKSLLSQALSGQKQKPQSRPKSTQKQNQKSLSKKKSASIESDPKQKSSKKINVEGYSEKVRRNNRKFISRQGSSSNLQMRVPWGVNEPRLNTYVLQTLAKMQRIRQPDNQKKQQTFNTERSHSHSHLKQSEIKVQLTPKRQQFFRLEKKQKYKVVKSPQYEQKTNKKSKSKLNTTISTQEKTEKAVKKKQNKSPESKNHNPLKISQLISGSLAGQFQTLQSNNLYEVNYRIVKRKIIEIEVAVLKKIQNLTVDLNKGSLECQSIHESYENIHCKSSIILMSAVSGIKRGGSFAYPELQVIVNQKNGTFGVHKKVRIPYMWVYLVDIIPSHELKELKFTAKIKNKSSIDNIPFCKQLLSKLETIFQHNFLKTASKTRPKTTYTYAFRYQEQVSVLRLAVLPSACSLQCESGAGTNTYSIIETFQQLLGL